MAKEPPLGNPLWHVVHSKGFLVEGRGFWPAAFWRLKIAHISKLSREVEEIVRHKKHALLAFGTVTCTKHYSPTRT